ncbi:MAG: GspH/FimT family protein, partial [Endozoicomonas sp.]
MLVALSAPFMTGMIVDNRVANVTREVYSSLMLARSEAVKRQHTISLCSTIDGVSCDETNAGWHHGWLIFTDESQDGLINGTDQLLRRVGNQSDLVRIVWNRGFTVSFNSRGQTSTAGTFEVCDSSVAEAFVKAVVISMTGRLRFEDRTMCS